MKKTIILSLLASIFVFSNVVKADGHFTMSGFAEWLGASVDQTISDGGASPGTDFSGFDNGTYTRLDGTYSTTLDSGLDVQGNMTIHSRDCMGDRQNNCDVVNNNFVTISGAFGAISFGERFGAGAAMLSRLTASGPTAEPDGLNMNAFYNLGDAQYGAVNEVEYANNHMKLFYMSNVINGFSIAASYADYTGNHGIAGENQSQNTAVTDSWTDYSDMLSIFGRYEMDIDGIGLQLVYGVQTGNAGRAVTTDYNDLDETAYSVLITYGNFAADYRKNDAGNSGRQKNDGSGNDEGTSICGTYTMGNLGLGVCSLDSTFTTATNTTNEDKFITYNAQYELGGGMNVAVTYFDREQTENNVVDTDAEGIMTRLAIGF